MASTVVGGAANSSVIPPLSVSATTLDDVSRRPSMLPLSAETSIGPATSLSSTDPLSASALTAPVIPATRIELLSLWSTSSRSRGR